MSPILSPLVDQVCPDTPDTNKSPSALLNISSLLSPAIPENNQSSLHESLHLVLSSDESSLFSPPPLAEHDSESLSLSLGGIVPPPELLGDTESPSLEEMVSSEFVSSLGDDIYHELEESIVWSVSDASDSFEEDSSIDKCLADDIEVTLEDYIPNLGTDEVQEPPADDYLEPPPEDYLEPPADIDQEPQDDQEPPPDNHQDPPADDHQEPPIDHVQESTAIENALEESTPHSISGLADLLGAALGDLPQLNDIDL